VAWRVFTLLLILGGIGDASVFLYAFDLIEADGEDLRREPLEVRKATLASLLSRGPSGLRFNEHFDHSDGPLVFAHACKLGLEGIVFNAAPARPIGRGDRRTGSREPGRTGREAGSRGELGSMRSIKFQTRVRHGACC